MLVGDTSVGKSALIRNYLNNDFSDNYEPTVLDVFRGPKQFEGKQLELEIHDTSGDQHLGVNRQVCYNRTDCFMLCVAINNRTSFENINKWRAEIRQVCQETPIILVGTKKDLRGLTNDSLTE